MSITIRTGSVRKIEIPVYSTEDPTLQAIQFTLAEVGEDPTGLAWISGEWLTAWEQLAAYAASPTVGRDDTTAALKAPSGSTRLLWVKASTAAEVFTNAYVIFIE